MQLQAFIDISSAFLSLDFQTSFYHAVLAAIQTRSIAALFSSFHPLAICCFLCEFFIAACWVLSVVTRDFSYVDRIWSITPFLYAWIFAVGSGFDARTTLMAILATLWGLRLSYNFYRKGGYTSAGEDYRWAELKKIMGAFFFEIFNFFFIALYQNLLLMAIALPSYIAFEARGKSPLGFWDGVVATLFVLFVVGETIADQQQWTFQTAKYKAKAKGKKFDGNAYGEEFLTTGLFYYSRHPNFFCEMSIWWCFYAFSCCCCCLNWTMVGTVLLTLLFQGSTSFTEKLSVAKYPGYRIYQKTTSALIPLPPKHKAEKLD